MPQLKKVVSQNVVDQIMNTVIDSIIEGVYPAGSRLPSEFELMEQLGVGRNSLREAMKILSAIGIVEIKRGDGTYVCAGATPSMFDTAVYSILYSSSSKEEMLEFRKAIDENILQFAMQKITKEQIAALHENIAQFEERLSAGDYERAEQLDYEFHLMIIDACDNKLYIHMMKAIYKIFEKSIIQTVDFDKNESKAASHHKAILQCLEDKDINAISTVIGKSLGTWRSSAGLE